MLLVLGYACETHALATATDCLAGYYCASASTLRSPVKEYAVDYPSDGAAAPDTEPIAGVTNWWNYDTSGFTNGDVCERGNYCGINSASMTSCPAGYYCPDPFMAAQNTAYECAAGFYCSGGAWSMTPGNPYDAARTDGATGGLCSPGKYCDTGSTAELSCDPGFFNPNEMGKTSAACQNCPYGRYCPNSGESDIEDDSYKCAEGYYCTENSATDK